MCMLTSSKDLMVDMCDSKHTELQSWEGEVHAGLTPRKILRENCWPRLTLMWPLCVHGTLCQSLPLMPSQEVQ